MLSVLFLCLVFMYSVEENFGTHQITLLLHLGLEFPWKLFFTWCEVQESKLVFSFFLCVFAPEPFIEKITLLLDFPQNFVTVQEAVYVSASLGIIYHIHQLYLSNFVQVPPCFNYKSFIIITIFCSVSFPAFIFLKITMVVLGFALSYKFQNHLFNLLFPPKKFSLDFYWDCIEYMYQFGENECYNIKSSSM